MPRKHELHYETENGRHCVKTYPDKRAATIAHGMLLEITQDPTVRQTARVLVQVLPPEGGGK